MHGSMEFSRWVPRAAGIWKGLLHSGVPGRAHAFAPRAEALRVALQYYELPQHLQRGGGGVRAGGSRNTF